MHNATLTKSFLSGLRLELPYLMDALHSGGAFFCQPKHFHLLRELLEDHLRSTAGSPASLLCAGYDRGVDAYSLCIACLEATTKYAASPCLLLGTETLPENIQYAQRGIYPLDTVRDVPEALIRRYFLRSRDRTQPQIRLKPGIRALVNYRCEDLFAGFHVREPMDILFCRHILHHFEPRLEQALAERLRRYLAPGGFLFLGRDIVRPNGFTRVAPAVYQVR